MTVYIPIVGILWAVLVYIIIGIILYPFLVLWTNRFMATRPKGFGRVKWGKEMIASIVLWPIVVIACVNTEIRYRKKGYL